MDTSLISSKIIKIYLSILLNPYLSLLESCVSSTSASIYDAYLMIVVDFSDTLTSTLMPVKPFNDPPDQQVAREVEEFVPQEGEFSQPFVMYTNHLYVYPKYLKYDNQKSFTKVLIIQHVFFLQL